MQVTASGCHLAFRSQGTHLWCKLKTTANPWLWASTQPLGKTAGNSSDQRLPIGQPPPFGAGKGGKTLVALQSKTGIDALDPTTGKTEWAYEGGASTIPSSTTKELALVPSNGLTAIKPRHDSSSPSLGRKQNCGRGQQAPQLQEISSIT